jgi:cell division protein ZapB
VWLSQVGNTALSSSSAHRVPWDSAACRAQVLQRYLYPVEIEHCRKLADSYNFCILALAPCGKKRLHVDLRDLRPDDCTMTSDKNVYTEDDLRQLEQRIDELINTVGSLKNENTSLRQQTDKLVSERSQLIEKTELARSRVEAMISRLRSLELGS